MSENNTRSIGGSYGSKSINSASQHYSRAKGASGTRSAFEPSSTWGNGKPQGRQDSPRSQPTARAFAERGRP